VNSTPPLSSYNRFACLEVDTIIEPHICVANSSEVVQNPSHPPIPNRCRCLPAWERRLPVKFVVAASPGLMSLVVEVEVESTDTTVKRRTQAFIDCGAMGCFINIEWAKLNNIPTCPLTNPIPVYNVNGTANDTGMITDITDVVLQYDNHSECTQLAVTRLGKQSMIIGYNWLRNHNPEINWQTKEVKMSRCPHQCSTCQVEDKRGENTEVDDSTDQCLPGRSFSQDSQRGRRG
jgi:hypothetical protein